MALFDRLSQRGINRLGRTIKPTDQSSILGVPTQKPLPTIPETLGIPPAIPPATRPAVLSTTPVTERMTQLPQRGAIGSMPQFAGINKRFVADLPANVQLKAISDILSGIDSNSPIINNFVRGMAAQGKTPEDIRQAFIAQQKTSSNPLVIL